MVSIGSTSPFEMVAVVSLVLGSVAIASTPVFLYAGEVDLTVDGVAESDVFTEIERETSRSLFGQPTLTVHVALGKPVEIVSSTTESGRRMDSKRLQMQTTTVKIQCEPGHVCIISARRADGTLMDRVTVTVERESYV
jgi:hypothetical protein